MPLDLTKPIRTRDGTKVRILCTDAQCLNGDERQPIVGLVEGLTEPVSWGADGSYMASQSGHILDLVNAPQKKAKATVEVRLWKEANGTIRSLSNVMRTGAEWNRYGAICWISSATVEMEYDEDQT